jgi:photosystem II PsbU protein
MRQFKVLIGFMVVVLMSSFIWLGWSQPTAADNGRQAAIGQLASVPKRLCVDTGQKIDLNNANMMAFTDCPGFYPTLAKIIVQHGPYDRVEDVLKIENLSSQQKQMLKANLDFFTISAPVVSLEMRMPPRPVMRAN